MQARSQETAPLPGEPGAGNACVVLLHGLGRTYRSMDMIASALRDAGYEAISVDYPSRSKPIEALAVTAVPQGLQYCRNRHADRIHFVTHSMGGLVLRYYLASHPVPELGKVVMLSPPNQGSEVADALVGTVVYDRINGPAGGQLGTGPDGIAARLGRIDYTLGIITGNEQTAVDSWLARQIPGQNDGKVSVARAKVEGMTDFLVLPVTHTFIVMDDKVIAQTLHFLRHGRFRREGIPTEAADLADRDARHVAARSPH
ncbi:esterase/lipase family protein [Luteimonas cucumeris]|nr:alpha/beta fold hydrolase [Luteimonas cucumeris]